METRSFEMKSHLSNLMYGRGTLTGVSPNYLMDTVQQDYQDLVECTG